MHCIKYFNLIKLIFSSNLCMCIIIASPVFLLCAYNRLWNKIFFWRKCCNFEFQKFFIFKILKNFLCSYTVYACNVYFHLWFYYVFLITWSTLSNHVILLSRIYGGWLSMIDFKLVGVLIFWMNRFVVHSEF